MSKYSFLILHYISIDDTISCIESIEKLYSKYDYNIVIVDNGSYNNSGVVLKQMYENDPKITVILSKKNLGFANGNNLGFKYIKDNLKSDYIIMINNDIVMIDKDFLDKVDKTYKKEEFAVLGPKIILKDGSVSKYRGKLNTVKEQKKLIRYLYFRLFLNYIFLTPLIEKYRKRKRNNNFELKLESNIILHGSALIFSKKYIDLFDGIDDRTFLYCEEELLYIRLMKNNLKSIYNPDLYLQHNEDGATKSSNKNSRKKNIFVDKNLIKSNKILLEELKSLE